MSEKCLRRYSRLCYLLVALVVVFLFVENFVFSSGFDILGFRAYDDVGFQASLRRMHLLLQARDWSGFLLLNDYAYGWVYWAFMALITYPFFLLEQSYSLVWPLIVIPRQVSLVFAVLSMWVMHTLLRRFDVPRWACASAVLIFILFPSLGYFSLRFGTVNAVTFFSLLTLSCAFTQAKLTPAGGVRVALSLAIAGAIKLSGLLIAPLIAALVLRRIERRRALATIVPAAVIFCVALVVLTNPSFLWIPSEPHYWTDYIGQLQKFLEVTRVPSGPANPLARFYSGVFVTFGGMLAMGTLAVGWYFAVRADRSRRFDMLAVLALFILAAGYLVISVKNVGSVGSYFTGVSFVLLLGVIGYARVNRGIYVLGAVIVLLAAQQVYMVHSSLRKAEEGTSHASFFVKRITVQSDTALARAVKHCIEEHSAGAPVGQIFMDFTLPMFMNSLSDPQTCVSLAWNNLSPAGKYCGRPIDFMVLDTEKAVGALPDDKFNEKVSMTNGATAQAYRQDRHYRQQILQGGEFDGRQFTLVCDIGRARVLKAVAQ
ncbi:hypothetical protein [Pseudomonas sp. UFMG81]|uniref:hypothetical protein n=1 Tax=Pseudomonas sp. UFMG81 TaxID=2745936 RepID=UPI00188F7D07|nr:hypothetical protein [Pseudomonas sp. UFMG81]